nr:MAG TPA: Lysis protein [Bacteriophage sp.]
MKKRIFLPNLVMLAFVVVIAGCLSIDTSAGSVRYNKTLAQVDLVFDMYLNEPKDVYSNFEYLSAQGISDIAIFNYYQEINYENGTLIAFWKFQDEYVSDSFFRGIKYIDESRPAIRLYWKDKGAQYQPAIEKKYFKVNERTEIATVKYLKAERIKIEDDSPFKEKIVLTEFINFQRKNIGLQVNCYVTPFKTLEKYDWNRATSSDELIEMFGLPDKKDAYSFKWPDKKVKNGIYYDPKISAPVWGEHWRYKRYPDLVIDISGGGKIQNFITDRDYKFYSEVGEKK